MGICWRWNCSCDILPELERTFHTPVGPTQAYCIRIPTRKPMNLSQVPQVIHGRVHWGVLNCVALLQIPAKADLFTGWSSGIYVVAESTSLRPQTQDFKSIFFGGKLIRHRQCYLPASQSPSSRRVRCTGMFLVIPTETLPNPISEGRETGLRQKKVAGMKVKGPSHYKGWKSHSTSGEMW